MIRNVPDLLVCATFFPLDLLTCSGFVSSMTCSWIVVSAFYMLKFGCFNLQMFFLIILCIIPMGTPSGFGDLVGTGTEQVFTTIVLTFLYATSKE
jgi:hypothetical protein